MSTTLYLGDLSSVCTVADLEKEFLPFGALHDIRIATDPITGQTLYGFVDFKCKKSALRACGALNGKFVCGRSMRLALSKSTSKKKQETIQCAIDRDSSFSNNVEFIFSQMRDNVNEYAFYNIFSSFGNVLNVTITNQTVTHNEKSGYGSIQFANSHEGSVSARNVVVALRSGAIDNVAYVCSNREQPTKHHNDRLFQAPCPVSPERHTSFQESAACGLLPAHQVQSQYMMPAQPPQVPLYHHHLEQYQQLNNQHQHPTSPHGTSPPPLPHVQQVYQQEQQMQAQPYYFPGYQNYMVPGGGFIPFHAPTQAVYEGGAGHGMHPGYISMHPQPQQQQQMMYNLQPPTQCGVPVHYAQQQQQQQQQPLQQLQHFQQHQMYVMV